MRLQNIALIVFKMATCVQVSGLHSACSFTARPFSSMQNCLDSNISSTFNSKLSLKRDILLKFTWGVRISTRPRLVFQGLSGSHPRLEGSWILELWDNPMWATMLFQAVTFVWSAVYIAARQEWSPSRQKVPPPIVKSSPSSFLARDHIRLDLAV